MSIDVIGYIFYGFSDDECDGLIGKALKKIESSTDKPYGVKCIFDEKEKIEDLSGCTFDGVNHEGFPIFFVSIKEGTIRQSAARYTEKIDTSVLKKGNDWNQKLENFCKELGIPFIEPSWHLSAYMG